MALGKSILRCSSCLCNKTRPKLRVSCVLRRSPFVLLKSWNYWSTVNRGFNYRGRKHRIDGKEQAHRHHPV